jgi:hypothetical protein
MAKTRRNKGPGGTPRARPPGQGGADTNKKDIYNKHYQACADYFANPDTTDPTPVLNHYKKTTGIDLGDIDNLPVDAFCKRYAQGMTRHEIAPKGPDGAPAAKSGPKPGQSALTGEVFSTQAGLSNLIKTLPALAPQLTDSAGLIQFIRGAKLGPDAMTRVVHDLVGSGVISYLFHTYKEGRRLLTSTNNFEWNTDQPGFNIIYKWTLNQFLYPLFNHTITRLLDGDRERLTPEALAEEINSMVPSYIRVMAPEASHDTLTASFIDLYDQAVTALLLKLSGVIRTTAGQIKRVLGVEEVTDILYLTDEFASIYPCPKTSYGKTR